MHPYPYKSICKSIKNAIINIAVQAENTPARGIKWHLKTHQK